MENIRILPLKTGDNLWDKVANYAENCSWRAGANLSKLMKENNFTDWEKVFVALADDDIAGFCTLSKTDCIPNLPYTPYIGFVFVNEIYRGKRISETLCKHSISYAKSLGFEKVYLISDHVNLYEKYGFVEIDKQPAPWGAMETIYVYDNGGVGSVQNP